MMKIITGKNNPILRSRASKIDNITPETRHLVEKMFQIMKEANGIGLAAPQIGKSIQLFVVDGVAFDKERSPDTRAKHLTGLSKWEFKKIAKPDVSKGYAFINPSISTYPKGKDGMREGCLSLPGWDGVVTRSKRITMRAQNINGEVFKLQAQGLLARVLQHEYDHLQGVLICGKWKNPRKLNGREYKVKGIVFFGSSLYSQIVLDKLKGTPYEPDVIIGEANKLMKIEAKSYTIGILAFYGAIIPTALIKKFRYGILNIHPSLLPKYKGPSPVQTSIINGDTLMGVTIIRLSEKIDTGDIIAQLNFIVAKKYTTPELHRILFTLGADLLVRILPLWMEGKIVPIKQNEDDATYTKPIKKKDGLIDWSESAFMIERKIRAFQPWPTTYTFFEHKGKILRIQLLEAEAGDPLTSHNEPGNIVRNRELTVQCGKGSLLIKKLRPEGKKEMSGEEFLRGYAQNPKFKNQNAKLQFES